MGKKHKKTESNNVPVPVQEYGTTEPVKRVQFAPMGVDHKLQYLITNAMDRIVMMGGTTTLAELGYLHQISIAYIENRASIRIYFHPKLACVKKRNINGSEKLVPREEFKLFENYFFVGDVKNAVTFENIEVPRCYIDEDPYTHHATLFFKKNMSKTEEIEVMVLNCNFPITVAAAMGVSLATDFKIKFSSVNAVGTNVAGNLAVTVGAHQEFPITVIAEYNPTMYNPGYDPEDAVSYLMNMASVNNDAARTHRELARKVSDQAKKNKKTQEVMKSGSYLKYR